MKISVVGTGYVGLVAGACFADAGNEVICLDVDHQKILKLLEGNIPIFEPGLDQIVKRSVQKKNLFFTTNVAEAVQNSEIIFFAVGTPPLPNGRPDLSALKNAAQSIAKHMKSKKIIVNKSTVPVGAHRLVADWMKEVTDQDFEVVSNPEFLKEGHAIEDFMKPDRVVLGVESDWAYEKILELYQPFLRNGGEVLKMDPVSAELTKYACNSFLATKISFMNELSHLCEAVGANIDFIRLGMGSDHRIGKNFLNAGAGYGGSCFPKDVDALLKTAEDNQVELQIVSATEKANQKQKKVVFKKLLQVFGGKEALKNKKIGIWGLAFKPQTDDIREASALTLIKDLIEVGAEVIAYDPAALDHVKKVFDTKIQYSDSPESAAFQVDALVLMTEWNEFKNIDLKKIHSSMKNPVLVDGRNVYDPKKIKSIGFRYESIGR